MREAQPTVICPVEQLVICNGGCSHTLHEFKSPVIIKPDRELLSYSPKPEQNNGIATFEKGIKGNAY
jgi:hypothetical protein